jgi:hypothetical protein
MEPNALALEYQAEYGSARSDGDITNIVNNPNASRVVRVFGPGLLEQASDLRSFELRPFLHNGTNTLLVSWRENLFAILF